MNHRHVSVIVSTNFTCRLMSALRICLSDAMCFIVLWFMVRQVWLTIDSSNSYHCTSKAQEIGNYPVQYEMCNLSGPNFAVCIRLDMHFSHDWFIAEKITAL